MDKSFVLFYSPNKTPTHKYILGLASYLILVLPELFSVFLMNFTVVIGTGVSNYENYIVKPWTFIRFDSHPHICSSHLTLKDFTNVHFNESSKHLLSKVHLNKHRAT